MANTTPNGSTASRGMRRRTSNRLTASSFLSSIELKPTRPVSQLDPSPEDDSQSTTDPLPTPLLDSAGTPTTDREYFIQSPVSVSCTPLEMRAGMNDSRRSHSLGKKEETATSFLSGISLRGDKSITKSRDKDGVLQDPRDVSSGLGSTQEQDSVMAEGSTTIENDKSVTPREPQEELAERSLQRSASTPSLTSSWVRGSSDIGTDTFDASDKAHAARRRKVTSPSAYPTRDPLQPHHRSAATKHGSLQKGASSGLLSALLARESETGARDPSSEMALVPSNRYALQKGPSRWLGPLTEHVLIKPLLTSGTAHIVKKIFRRPSFGIPRRDSSRSQGTSSHGLTTPRQLYRTSSQSTVRLKPPQDSQRHIFYHGTDLTNSCVSLAENLSQHAYMFTTAHGSPLIFSSLLRYNDEKAPNKRRRRRFDREYLQQITKEALVRKKANSFAYLLTQSNALDPEQEDSSSYDPYYLDDPELKTGKNRTVISLACYMGSVIQYTRPSDLKRELNEHFRSRHPTIDPSITLSKIRKVKSDLLAISEELDLEISTAALAYAYFEKLVLKGTWKGKDGNSTSTESSPSPVTKENRKLMACVCLLLAYKVNEPKRPPGEFTALMKQMTKHMDVTTKDVKEHEFQVFSLLDFNLYLPRQEFLPHFEQILYRQDYINVQEYLGEDEFYSVAQQSRKVVE